MQTQSKTYSVTAEEFEQGMQREADRLGPVQRPETQEKAQQAGIILERHHLGAVAFCSADNGRYQIAGLNVRADGSVEATDGKMAIRVPASSMPGSDYPAVPGAGDKPIGKDVILPAETVKQTLKALPKRSHIPILGCAALALNGNPENPTLTTTDLETPIVRHVNPVQGRFPDIDQVMPDRDKEGGIRIGLNADLLRTICDYAIKYGRGGNSGVHAVQLTVYPDKIDADKEGAEERRERDGDVTTAMRWDLPLPHGGNVIVALMPCRVTID